MIVESSTQKLCETCEAKTLHILVRVSKSFSQWFCTLCQLREKAEELARE